MASGHGVPKPDTANHPGRDVHRERWIPNYDYDTYAQEDEDTYQSEPDYESIMEARAERRRPDWAQ
jgi:hypothetical protein